MDPSPWSPLISCPPLSPPATRQTGHLSMPGHAQQLQAAGSLHILAPALPSLSCLSWRVQPSLGSLLGLGSVEKALLPGAEFWDPWGDVLARVQAALEISLCFFPGWPSPSFPGPCVPLAVSPPLPSLITCGLACLSPRRKQRASSQGQPPGWLSSPKSLSVQVVPQM